jgi:hypothetical protein
MKGIAGEVTCVVDCAGKGNTESLQLTRKKPFVVQGRRETRLLFDVEEFDKDGNAPGRLGCEGKQAKD